MRRAAIASAVVLSVAACCLQAQNLGSARGVFCPATHLRFTARRHDGSPVAGLTSPDILVWFGGAAAQVLSLKNSVASGPNSDTNILFVVPPFFRLDQYSIKRLIAEIRRADNVHVVAAVLAPDGKVSAFSSDAAKLNVALVQSRDICDVVREAGGRFTKRRGLWHCAICRGDM